ncbi:dicarboxylate transporter/tellurite-resistance protein TehA [Variovorax sp. GT1P44]|uniref:dicarboxylate transporter/tellurite-resistance protein TehA n=1 Tax=Variovorax sp. GT1P44 TaxID=3443742 RepID=UPI003F4554ED
MSTRPSIAVSLFGMPVGILGLAGAWRVGARIWNLPSAYAIGIGIFGVTVWLVLLLLYAYKWYRYRAEAFKEFRDPVQSSFVSLVMISTMLASTQIIEVAGSAGTALFGVSVAVQFALGVWLLGRMWQGGQGADFATPALYLPTVGQSFVAANGAAALGWWQIGAVLFGCGVLSWLATESLVLSRAATREPIPPGLRPALGVQLAPPVVGGLAYLSLTSGAPDLAAHMLFGYGLYQAALLSRLFVWIRQPSFTATYWSFSFGVTALPTMGMRMIERGDAGPMLWAGPVLFIFANLFIGYLVVCSLRLLVQGRLFQSPAAPREARAALSGPEGQG